METLNKLAIVVFVIILVAIARGCDVQPRTTITEESKADTLFVPVPVHDTIWKDTTRIIRIPIPCDLTDSDSVFIMASEIKHYHDSTYEAWVSGIEPSLDSIRVFRKTIIRTVTHEVPVYKYSSPVIKEKPVQFGGFLSASTGLGLNHINAQGGLEIDVRKFSVKAGYNVGEYNYPFVGLEYKIR